ncbi:MAG TPA: exonuclease domain-containing protein [Bacteroidota bacterium]|nr:exonuclease domain-containing protein [Bacteroidota bacterium]
MHEGQLIFETDFVVVDVETTGLSPTEDRLTEISMMKVRNGTLVDEFTTLINPLIPIPSYITELTGIDNLMVQDAPPAREIVPRIAEFLHNGVFTAHNAPFDWGFVYHTAFRERGIELLNPQLCTARLSRKILPHLPSKSLGPVAKFMDIDIPARHRASGDAYATAMLLIKYLSYLEKRYAIKTLGELLRFQYYAKAMV